MSLFEQIAPPLLPTDHQDLDQFLAVLKPLESLFITAHVGPDGDTLGAMLGMKHAMLSAPEHFPNLKRVDCVISGRMPDSFNYLPGIETVINVEADDAASKLLAQYDAALSVDCGSADRLGPARAYFDGAKTSLNLDHHISNKRFGQHNLVLTKAASSTQVVAVLLAHAGIAVNQVIGDCLYTGLLTDTGGFKYANTNANVFQLAAHLLEAGTRSELVYKRMFEDRPRCQVMLQAEAVQQAGFNAAETLAWTKIPRAMLDKYGARDEHLEGLVEMLRQIESVQVSCILKETRNGDTKISLRSDTHAISVAAVVEPLGGGGHAMAAGCTLAMPLDEAWTLLQPKLEALVSSQASTGDCVEAVA